MEPDPSSNSSVPANMLACGSNERMISFDQSNSRLKFNTHVELHAQKHIYKFKSELLLDDFTFKIWECSFPEFKALIVQAL
jgi:hypothetical protein